MYYPVLTTRSLVFVVGQLYVEQEFVQKSLNFAICCLLLAGIIIFKPFKEKATMISELIGEFCVIFIILLSGFMLPSNTTIPTDIMNPLFIYIIITAIGIQSIISLGSLYSLIKEIFNKFRQHRLKKVTKRSQKVFPEKSYATTLDLTDNNNKADK